MQLRPEWLELKAAFEEAIMAGPHGETDPTEYTPRMQDLAKKMMADVE